jgi:hypothetical protein
VALAGLTFEQQYKRGRETTRVHILIQVYCFAFSWLSLSVCHYSFGQILSCSFNCDNAHIRMLPVPVYCKHMPAYSNITLMSNVYVLCSALP